MCGITGIVHFGSRQVDRNILDRMTDALVRRGPDGRGVVIEDNVGLGHRRLKILDLSDAGKQPMASDDGTTIITFNGEIYNYKEKRSMLESRGYKFKSRTDTEVLLKLYEEFGEECLTYLRGMFAFAIFDRKRKKLFCARDRAGMKPFKYFFDGKTFLFASELKALFHHPACDRSIDEEALYHAMTMTYIPSPGTGFRNIKKLSPAHALTLDVESGNFKIWQYWSLSFHKKEERSIEDWSERIMEKIDESVRLRMVADVPVGAFLSGGIDSSTVCTLMSKASGDPIRTFSIGRDDAKDESKDAERIAEIIGSHHQSDVIKPDIPAILPELVHAYEEPYADPSALPTYLLSGFTRKHVTVALNGDGGDENFAGYLRHAILKFSLLWEKAPRPLHTPVQFGAWSLKSLFSSTFLYFCHEFERTINLPWSERFLRYNSALSQSEKKSVMTSDFLSRISGQSSYRYFAEISELARSQAEDKMDQALSVDLWLHLADCLLHKVDIASMAHGLECRSPLLDHELLELTSKIPSRLKLKGFRLKWIFKKALEGVLPAETLYKKKQGFRIPLDPLFRGELKSYVSEKLMGGALVRQRILDEGKIAGFLDEYYRSRIDYSQHIWTLLCMDEWVRQAKKS